MGTLLIILFIVSMPRSLWFIPIFIVLWALGGGDSGGSNGMGNNFGYSMIPVAFFVTCAWGVFENVKTFFAYKKHLKNKSETNTKL